MKSFRTALLLLAALALSSSTVSATVVTSPSGTQYSGTLSAGLKTSWNLGSSFIGNVNCNKSTFEGKVETQGSAATASGKISLLTFTECNGTVTVLKNGSFEIHTDSATADGNGIITLSGTEITVELAGLHCIFSTSNTTMGTVTGGTTATWDTEFFSVKRTGGRSGSFCGTTAQINAEYVFTTPDTLLID
jgi:hypothetical protein